MLRRILSFILIVGVCTTIAYGEGVKSNIDMEALGVLSETSDSSSTVPQILLGQERQTAYATPASTDGSVSAVPYTADVSEWFEHEEGISYAASSSILSAKINLDKSTGELKYIPDMLCGNSDFHIYVTASNEIGKSEKIDIIVNVGKVPKAENSALGTCRNTYYKFGNQLLQPNIFADIVLNGNVLKGIFCDDQMLLNGTDYTYGNEKITISESFYRNLEAGDYTLTFKFNGGEDLLFTLKVRNSSDNAYQVTCRSRGVVGMIEQFSCGYGETVSLPILTGNSYYEFGGWWTQADGEEPAAQFTSETPITKNTVLSARWNKLVQCPETDDKNASLSVLGAKLGTSVMYPAFRNDIHDYYLNVPDDETQFADFSFEKENIMGILEYAFSGENIPSMTQSETTSIYTLTNIKTVLQDGKFDKITIKITSPDQSITEEYRIHLRYDNEPLKHSVSFVNNGEEHFRSEMVYGSNASLPITPTKSGYRFCGWFTEENGSGDEFTEKTLVLSDMTVFACWKRNTPRRTTSTTNTKNVLAVLEDKEISENIQQNNKREYRQYIHGYSDNTFRPDSFMTRAEAATIFMRISEDYDSSFNYPCNFNDTTDNDWYYNAVCYIDSKAELSKTNKNFYPENEITRGEFCVLLTKLFDISLTETDIVFSDIENTEELQAAGVLYQMGVINGYGDNNFHPDLPITRAEVVTIINKIYKINADTNNNNIFSDVLPEHWAYNNIIIATIQ